VQLVKRIGLLPVLLGVALLLLLAKDFLVEKGTNVSSVQYGVSKVAEMAPFGGGDVAYPNVRQVAPSETKDRMVVQNTSLSLLVKDVGGVISSIEKLANRHGGYMVSYYQNRPEEASTGSISIRVLADERSKVLEEIRVLGVRVVAENVWGSDVTDQYQDLQARLDVLAKTKQKLELIFSQAENIPDLLNVQRELINLQSEIDSIKGQQKYLEQTARLTLIDVSLSTDELALPYAPDKAWRPAVIIKMAVRSLVGSVRSVVTALIWFGVYSVVWVPILLVIWLLVRLYKRPRV